MPLPRRTAPRPPGRVIGLALLLALAAAPPAAAEALALTAAPVPLDEAEAARSTVDMLVYRGGLHIDSPHRRFGGWSALHVAPDGGAMVAVSDDAAWLAADLRYDARGWLVGIEARGFGRLAGPDGTPIAHGKSWADAESLAAMPDGGMVVSFERHHRLWRYPPATPPFSLPPVALPAPAALADAPNNDGVEALTRLADGRLLAIAEGLPAGTGAVAAWLWDGAAWATLSYAVSGSYKPTGAATLPSGDVVVVERRFNPIDGIAVRLRRVKAAAITPGARLEAELLARLASPLVSDNLEGIAARRGDGESLIYLLSDDNFKSFQRTLLLLFALPD